jgi:hypothetical protein
MAAGHGRLDANRRYSRGREYDENEYGGLPVNCAINALLRNGFSIHWKRR